MVKDVIEKLKEPSPSEKNITELEKEISKLKNDSQIEGAVNQLASVAGGEQNA